MRLIVIIIGAWILLLLQNILYQRYWQQGLTARLSFIQKAAVEGDHAQLKEIITNRKFLPLPVLHVKFQMGRHLVFSESSNFKITDKNYRSDIFSCMPWQEIRRTLDFVCQKRGYYQIRSIDLVSYDLFFFGHCVASVPEDTFLYVYPGPADPVRLEMPLKNLMGQILARQALLTDPFETQSVRPYQSYDPYKTVNWKATAHTGELKVNVYTPASSWNVTILLDMESSRLWADEDLTEEAVRLCGSMAERMVDQGIPVAIYSNGTDCLTGLPSRLEAGAGKEHLRSIMELLARIQISSGTAGAHGAADSAAAADSALQAARLLRGGTAPAGGSSSEKASASSRGKKAPQNASRSRSLLDPAPPPTASLNTGAKIAGQSRNITMEDILFFMTDDRSSSFGSDSTMYIMISPGQRVSLTEHFDALCRQSPGSQWILPKRPGEELRIAPLRFAEIYEWEVPYGHSQAI